MSLLNLVVIVTEKVDKHKVYVELLDADINLTSVRFDCYKGLEQAVKTDTVGWRSTLARTLVLASKLSLSHARPSADG